MQGKKLHFNIDIGAVLDRHGFNSYSIHRDEYNRTTVLNLPPYDLHFNLQHGTLMISGRAVPEPTAVLFADWSAFDLGDVRKLGVDHGWWHQRRPAVLEIIKLMIHGEPEPAAAVEDPHAQVDPAPDVPTGDTLHDFSAVFDVTLSGVAQHPSA